MSSSIAKSLLSCNTQYLKHLQINPLAPRPKAGLFVFSCPGGEITTDENSVVEPIETAKKLKHINEEKAFFMNMF